MSRELYTIFEAAQLLGLHEKTVRGYVHEGKLASTRVGKRYRITREALDAFTGGALASTRAPVEADVSSVVHVSGLTRRGAERLTTALMGACKGRDESRALRVDTLFEESRNQLKVVIIGSPESTALLLGMIDHLKTEL